MREPLLSADIAALADFLRAKALAGAALPPDGLSFVAGALDTLAVTARTQEADFQRESLWRVAGDARIAALTTPDHLREAEINIAIAAAANVFDLRPYLEREIANGRAGAERAPEDSAADVSSGGKDGDAA